MDSYIKSDLSNTAHKLANRKPTKIVTPKNETEPPQKLSELEPLKITKSPDVGATMRLNRLAQVSRSVSKPRLSEDPLVG